MYNQSILKEISPEYSLEGLMLKLKLQYIGHLMQKNWLIWKGPDAGKDWRQEGKGTTESEMVGWHHQLNGLEFEWTPGVGDGQGRLACCSPWGCKESDMTERLNWTALRWIMSNVEHVFMCLLIICISPLDKCLFRSFLHFFIYFFLFLVLSSWPASIFLKLILCVSLGIIFSYSEDCLFTLLIVSFSV